MIISKEATNMAKRDKVIPKADTMPQDGAMEQLIESAINEIKEEVPVINEPKQPEKRVDISSIIAVIPDTFTPATLDKLFLFNDGGKTVRRHLRKYFATAMGHEHKSNWVFNKTANADVIEYFAAKYAFDLNAIK